MEYRALGELCTVTSSKRIFAEQYVSEGVPFYRSREIIEKNGNQDLSLELFISEEVYNSIKEKFGVPQTGDLLMTSVGTLGIPYVVKDERFYFKDGNLTWMRDFSEELNSQYLYYWFSSGFGKQSLIQKAIGSSQPALTIEILKKYKLLVPPRREQDSIVEILSKYDELLEANNKRIKILEQMAENLYKEWFVRFRFPGHEDVEFVAGEPKDWELKRLEKIIKIDRGLSYSSEEIDCDDGSDLINLKNIQAYGGFRVDGTKKYSGQFKESQVVKRGDLVMGVTDMTQDRRTVGAVALIPMIHNTSVISADLIRISSKYNNVFLYCMFKYGGVSRYISQFANGANVLHLRPQVVNRVKVYFPTKNVIDMFAEIVQPIIDEIDTLNEGNDNLIRQRDLLLPRLMSGKIQVK